MRCKLCLKVVRHPSVKSKEIQVCGACSNLRLVLHQKSFNHVEHPEIPYIKQISSNGKRHYETPHGDFISITTMLHQLPSSPELDEQWKRISESVYDKLNDIATGVCDSEDDRAAIARFKKPYKQLSDTEKETLEENLDDQFTLDAITYCLITRATEIWTPKFWRIYEVAAKIAEVEQAEYEKEKAKAEKRVPEGAEKDGTNQT